MQIDSEQLRQYYASLSDESLLALDRDELTEAALQVYDEEIDHRGLKTEDLAESDLQAEHATGVEEPDWLAEAGCACTFAAGHRGHEAASDAEHARVVLEAAGIPCHVFTHSAEDDPKQGDEYRVMVPGNLTMPAASVLDKEIFNAEIEAEWRLYFDSLSDQDLRAADPEGLFAGLQDRLDRAARAYNEALTARGIQAN